jgi:hypothetical protein
MKRKYPETLPNLVRANPRCVNNNPGIPNVR